MTLVFALILDAVCGEPRWLWSRAPHPAVLMGRAVGWCDRRFNAGRARRVKGGLTIASLGGLGFGIGWLIEVLPPGWLWSTLLAAILLAQRSLVAHVQAVADALRYGVVPGRKAVAMIVGRDTEQMSEAEIARAAIESAAENLSDGVVAPAFWYLLLGLPGIVLYKVTNTADSMIGHRTPRHAAFGWAAARLDDVLNWVPARLTAILIAAASATPTAWRVACRDANLHRSPNAGWPEAAMAAALNTALSGPRNYGGSPTPMPLVYPEGRRCPGVSEIEVAIAILWRSWVLLVLLALVCAAPR
ncbi:MAG: cobalamin biosynthesis protein [Rhodobacteraceae bacterium]|nr:cobalamin biosynthesis protein [Paracoccaceae bacterium]